MSEEATDLDMNFDRRTDVPPDELVPAGFYEGTVAGVQFMNQGADDKPFPGATIARIQYRLDHSDAKLNGRYIRPFPMPVRGDKDAWKWFAWCKMMGYDTSGTFTFNISDVEGAKVSLRFGPPRTGKDGKVYDNLEEVSRLA